MTMMMINSCLIFSLADAGTRGSEPFVASHGSHQPRNDAGTRGIKLADLPEQQGLI